MLITMMGAFAQAESESISHNVRWGIRQAMREGRATVQYKNLYGYGKDEDGNPYVIPEEAEAVSYTHLAKQEPPSSHSPVPLGSYR